MMGSIGSKNFIAMGTEPDGLDYCSHCGDYLGPENGEIRRDKEGKLKAVCQTCCDTEQIMPQDVKRANTDQDVLVFKLGKVF